MYKKEVITSFETFTPTTKSAGMLNTCMPYFQDAKSELITLALNNEQLDILTEIDYSIISELDNDATDVRNHMPVILTEGGIEPVRYANQFLWEKSKTISVARLDGYADSLCRFLNFCEGENINYFECSSFVRSPLTRYSNELHYRQCNKSYIKDELSRLVTFYNYLIDKCSIQFKTAPFGDKADRKVWYSFGSGIEKKTVGKSYITTELQSSIKGTGKQTSEKASYHGTVHDGGEALRPLSEDEIAILFEALNEIDNTEGTLAHQIAIGTGARKQTVLTLRHIHFERELNDNENNVIIVSSLAGKTREETEVTSLINAKGDNRFVMYFPRDLYLAVQRYIQSERAQSRYKKAKPYHQHSHQYVFVTERGNPYYMSKRDPYRPLYRHPPCGGTMDSFINKILKPVLKAKGFEDPERRYKYHDCRATFGMMRLDSQLANIDKTDLDSTKNIGQIYDKILLNVQRYMNHKSMKTTLQYLDLRRNDGLLHRANLDFAEELKVKAHL